MSLKRIWEIDALRGIAIVSMVIFHTVWALNFFDVIKIDLKTSSWIMFQLFIGITFLLIVGISLTLSYARIKNKKVNVGNKYLMRGLKLLGIAMLVTLATHIAISSGTVFFGVLHLIAVSIIISVPFLNKRITNLVLGIFAVLLGILFSTVTVSSPFLVWLGFRLLGFYTIDYYPVFPWFGIVLIGMYLGNTFYPGGERTIKIFKNKPKWSNILSWLGRHSLKIYFFHAVVIYFSIKIIHLMI